MVNTRKSSKATEPPLKKAKTATGAKPVPKSPEIKTKKKPAKSASPPPSLPAKRTRAAAKPVSKQPQPKKAATKKTPEKKPPVKKEPAKKEVPKKSPAKQEAEVPEKTVKAILKGRVAVDPEFPDAANYHVYDQGSKVWACTLNQTQIGSNSNKFYIIQILQSDSNPNSFYTWNRWGRVGYSGQSSRKGPFNDVNRAKSDYQSKYNAKTRGGYVQIEIVYENTEEEVKKTPKAKKPKGVKKEESKLPQSLKELIGLIFDLNTIKKTLAEIGYDARKMPLGKLSQSTLMKGLQVLKEIEAVLDGKTRDSIESLSGKFFTLIPHDFGFQHMSRFVINTKKKLQEKIEMINSLTDMKIATNILQEDDSEADPVDQHYSKLNCDLQPVPKTDPVYKILCEYVKNTHASTHSNYTLSVEDIFRVERQGEKERFTKKIGNHMLLWHGSRLTNWVGILSQGLRIAPPEAPVSGYMFGKGVYFADMVSKSANYCFTNRDNNTGILLLCDVALGNMNEKLQADCYANNLPPGKHSTKGCGRTAPLEQSYVDLEGMKVPIGKGQSINIQGGHLLYNEYIVYDIAQIQMKFLFKMKFNYR